LPIEIIKPGTRIDFLGKWRICVAISIAVVLLGIAGIPLRGFRLGIDFAGGTEIQVRFLEAGPVDEGPIREVVGELGIPNASVTRFGGADSHEFLIKYRGGREIAEAPETEASADAPPEQGETSESGEEQHISLLEDALEKRIGPLEVERVEFVGPKVGADLREAGLKALAISFVLILIYIGFRFSPRFAPGAVIALIHDVLVTSSIWILLGLEFDLTVLAALLAIIGYSLNDTIIVYDRIRENMELRTKYDVKEVLNRSINQTLSRTLLTSFTTLIAVLALLALGGEVIWPFALAMTIGIAVGTYSSIYIASPCLLWLEARYGGASSGPRGSARDVPKPPKPPKREVPKPPGPAKAAKAGSRRRRRPS
jgi:preprotein translocase subunit SecF